MYFGTIRISSCLFYDIMTIIIKINLKTITPTKLSTSEYTFDIANEILKFGELNIDLKKIIGSTNQYTPDENKPNNNPTGDGSGTGSGNGSGTGTGNGGSGSSGTGSGNGENVVNPDNGDNDNDSNSDNVVEPSEENEVDNDSSASRRPVQSVNYYALALEAVVNSENKYTDTKAYEDALDALEDLPNSDSRKEDLVTRLEEVKEGLFEAKEKEVKYK